MAQQATPEQAAKRPDARKPGRLGLFVNTLRRQVQEKMGIDPETGLQTGDDPMVLEARKKAKAATNPGISFWDIFRAVDPATGKPLPYLERQRRNAQLGAYHAEALGKWAKGFLDRFRGDPDDVFDKANRIGDDFWDETKRAENVASDAAQDRTAKQQGPRVQRMGPRQTAVVRSRDHRVKFEPDNPENRLESDRVGPDRQVVRDQDGREALSGPGRKTAGAVVSAPRLLDGPRDARKKTDREAGAKNPETLAGRAPVSRRVAGPGTPGSGQAAAEKGAATARRMAQAAAAKKAATRKPIRKSRGNAGMER